MIEPTKSNTTNVMSEEFGIIYRLFDYVNEKNYIGQTKKTAEERFKDHISYHGHTNDTPVDRAIREFGPEAFEIHVIGRFPVDDLSYQEAKYIMEYNSLVPNGYNVQRHSGLDRDKIAHLYVHRTTAVEVKPIKENDKNRLVRVLLTVSNSSDRLRFMFGQDDNYGFEDAVDDALVFIQPFKEAGVNINIHPEILGEKDPLADYYLKLEQFEGKEIVRVLLTKWNQKSRGMTLIAVFIKLAEHRKHSDQIRVCFGGKHTTIPYAVNLAKLFVFRLPITDKTEIVDKISN